MGQSLSEPITTKCTQFAQNKKLKVGSSSMQGWRVTMEDAHTLLLEIPDDPDASFFGVFDGHGGARIAEYASKHLYKRIVNQELYTQGNIPEAIQNGFLDIDLEMRELLKEDLAGSTAIITLLKDNVVYCGNAGDSRAIAYADDRVILLSNDHKPTEPGEFARIKEAGGWVEYNRVNGNLALSRALGDYMFKSNSRKGPKEQIVTAFPEVVSFPITPTWEFIVLACDGIWDVMSNEEVAAFVKEGLITAEPEIVCEQLMMRCLAPDCQMGGYGCDNMTVTIIVFKRETTDNEKQTASEEKEDCEQSDENEEKPNGDEYNHHEDDEVDLR